MFQITLRAARVNKDLTQDEVSNAIRISKSTLQNWENGKTSPTAGRLKALAELYECPIEYIFLPSTYDTGVSKGCRAPECTHNDHQFTVAGKPKQRRAT